MKLSIIICLYDTRPSFFDECLRSLTRSTLRGMDYEICVVDDGSHTDYSEFVEKYGLKYKRTENRGIFAARLCGIEMASGEYVTFVDSDDTVSVNYHRPMIDAAENSGADIVINDWAFNTERSRYYCRGDSTVAGDVACEGDEVLYRFVKAEGREHSYYVLWNKVFRRVLLERVKEELFPLSLREERFNYAEDTMMTFFAFKYAKKLQNIHTGYYFYRVHAGQSVNVIDAARLKQQIECMGEALDTMEKNIGENKFKGEISKCVKGWRELMARTHYSHAKANNYCHLYDLIRDTYKVERLRISTFGDSIATSDNICIPYNFEEIDAALLQLWESDGRQEVNLRGQDRYVRRCVNSFIKSGRDIVISANGSKLPHPRVKFINKILLNRFVYSLGLILFKKGSRARNFLKRHI